MRSLASHFFTLILWLILSPINADVINPTLVEINLYDNNTVQLELTLNIEAVLSDSSLYKNSKNSPNSDKYDQLRALPPRQIETLFKAKLPQFLRRISLTLDNKPIKLSLTTLITPDIGYQGRPRASKLLLTGAFKQAPNSLLWQYDKAYGDSAYRYQFYQQDHYNWSAWQWIRADQTPSKVSLNNPHQASYWTIFAQYSLIGFLHILPKGLDHILFIIGIALLALSWRKLLLMVTLFTLAHSLTLALAIYGIVSVPASIVEPLIALSIAYIGLENLYKQPKNLHLKSRALVVFLFGLLHGLGFASVLSNFDLPAKTLALSLFGFNVGVELGQASIVLFILFLLGLARYCHLNIRQYIIIPSAILITLVGLIWTVQRIFI